MMQGCPVDGCLAETGEKSTAELVAMFAEVPHRIEELPWNRWQRTGKHPSWKWRIMQSIWLERGIVSSLAPHRYLMMSFDADFMASKLNLPFVLCGNGGSVARRSRMLQGMPSRVKSETRRIEEGDMEQTEFRRESSPEVTRSPLGPWSTWLRFAWEIGSIEDLAPRRSPLWSLRVF